MIGRRPDFGCGGSHSERGQADPTIALVGVLALCLGLSLYAVVLGDAGRSPDRDVASPTLTRVAERITAAGVADPAAVANATGVGPTGYDLNVSLVVGSTRWTVGDRPPRRADAASKPVSVRLEPGRIRPGVLRVAVWRGGA